MLSSVTQQNWGPFAVVSASCPDASPQTLLFSGGRAAGFWGGCHPSGQMATFSVRGHTPASASVSLRGHETCWIGTRPYGLIYA